MNWLERPLSGGTALDWIVASAVAVTLAIILYYGRRLLLRRLRHVAKRTATGVDDLAADVLGRTRSLFLLIVAAYVGAQWLDLATKPTRLINAILMVALLVQAALWGSRAIDWWLGRKVPAARQIDGARATTISVLGFIARVVLWSVVLLMILDNVGFDITTLVASLGIGGIAVALAAQNILGDIFASLSIALDKPFVIGDAIAVGDMTGTVEYIGLKTTRLRSVTGELLIFSNTDLLKSRIRNYRHMLERRVVFRLSVAPDTDADKLERIPQLVRAIIESHGQVRFDRAHFKEYGEHSLNFEVVYYVKTADYNLHMDIQQAINLALLRRFQSDGIGFAYATAARDAAESTALRN